MKRNLRFWTRYTWEGMSAVLIVLAILLVLSAIGASRLELTALAATAPAYLLLAAGLLLLALALFKLVAGLIFLFLAHLASPFSLRVPS